VASFDLLQVGARAEVGEEEEALREVLREHLRRVHAGFGQHARDAHEGPRILPVGRRIHGDVALAVAERGAKVAAEAGVFGSRGQREGGAAEVRCEPALEGIAPHIGVYH
jgi:hypothetical protein